MIYTEAEKCLTQFVYCKVRELSSLKTDKHEHLRESYFVLYVELS